MFTRECRRDRWGLWGEKRTEALQIPGGCGEGGEYGGDQILFDSTFKEGAGEPFHHVLQLYVICFACAQRGWRSVW